MSVRLEKEIANRFSQDPSGRVFWWNGAWEDAGEVERKTALSRRNSGREASSLEAV